MLSFFNTTTFAQYGYFEQGYGTASNEEALDILVTNDYKVILVGWYTTNNGDLNIQLIYTDSIGDTLWTRQLGGEGDDVATSVLKTENEFLVAGYTNSIGAGGFDAYLLSIDPSDGSTNWSYTYGSSFDEKAFSITANEDGSIYLAGYKEISNKDAVLFKISSSGLLISTNTFGGEGDQESRSIIKKDNFLYITGTDFSQLESRGFIVKTNTDGNQINYATTDINNVHEIFTIVNHFGKGYYLGGFSINSGQKDALIIKMDTAGNILDYKTIGNSNSDEYIKDLISIGDALFAVGGSDYQAHSEGGMDLFFITTDSLLDTISTIFAGGEDNDWGNSISHRNGLIYIAGYNSSFGIEETGNMYETRINLYDLIEVITSSGATSTNITSIPLPCKMQRVMYVEGMFGRAPTENEVASESYEPIFCRWCNNNDWEISSNEITNPLSNQYEGIIGNEDKEDELLNFCLSHNITQLVFYQSDYIFSDYAIDNYTKYYMVRLPNNDVESLSVFMKKKLHAFIRKAHIYYKVSVVGIAAGEYRLKDQQDPNNYIYANMLYLNTTSYNDFAKAIQVQNYSYSGKIREIALEHEFWNFNYNNGSTSSNTFTSEFASHKVWLTRMLNLSRNDFNLIFVDDYIAGMIGPDEGGDGTQSTDFLYRDQNFLWHFNTNVMDRIDSRVEELEELTDTKFFNKKIARFFQAYYLQCRFPTNQIQKNNSYNHHCDQPNTKHDIGGREAKWIGQTYYPDIPWHVEYLNYSLTRFGNRTNEYTQVYPLFGADAACINPSILSRDFKDEKYRDNYLGFWLCSLPQSGNELRTLKSAEASYLDNFPNSNFYSSRGSRIALNGFCYFSYQLLKAVSDYNIAQNQINNFSNNLSIENRELHEANSNFSYLPCSIVVPSGNNNSQYKNQTNIKNIQKEYIVQFYPIPVNNVLNYSVKTVDFDEIKIVVHDVVGKQVISTTLNGHEGGINMSELSNGLYFITYTCKAKGIEVTESQKIIIFK